MNNIIKGIKNLDKLTYKIMKNGLKCCLVICIISCILLLIYEFDIVSPTVYYIGITLFKLSNIFAVEFIICGIVVDSIKKQIF